MTRPSFKLALALALCACGGADREPAAPAASGDSGRSESPADDPSCPVAVPGTSVSVEDAEGGAALVFATTGDVAQVRSRAREMARIHNEEHARMGPLPTGEGGGAAHDHSAHQHGAAGGPAPPAGSQSGAMIQTHSHAAVEDTDRGARIVFHVDPKQATALHDELRQHAQHLSSGRCTMQAGADGRASHH